MFVTSDADLEPRSLPSTGLPGFAGTADLSVTQAARPVPRGRPVEGNAPSPHGLPVLRCVSVYRHAVVNTPVARWALIARGTAYSNRFPVPSGSGLPHHGARSATTLDFSRPAQRSLAVTACRLAESPIATRLSRRLRRFRFLHRRSDSSRRERPSCPVGFTPTEEQHLLHGALCLFLEEEDEYHRACRDLLERFAAVKDLIVAESRWPHLFAPAVFR